MRYLLAGLTFVSAMAAQAGTMNCLIAEGGAQVRETRIQHSYTDADVHSITTFESAYATGFVSVSRGYGVVNVVSKESGLATSFYGKLGNGNFVGGNIVPTKDPNSWLRVECQ